MFWQQRACQFQCALTTQRWFKMLGMMPDKKNIITSIVVGKEDGSVEDTGPLPPETDSDLAQTAHVERLMNAFHAKDPKSMRASLQSMFDLMLAAHEAKIYKGG